MDTISTISTSRVSADVTPIVLRENESFRLLFKPELVDNIHNKKQSVRGTFVFQRKGAKGTWETFPTKSLGSLKKEEEYKLELKSGELHLLIEEILKLYELYEDQGIQIGVTEYIPTTTDIKNLIGKINNNPELVEKLAEESNIETALNFLTKVLSTSESADILTELTKLPAKDFENLKNITNFVDISRLTTLLTEIKENVNNDDEEYWQRLFQENSWVISYIIASPVVIIGTKSYVGGKEIDNTSGKIVDFLYKNSITDNISLVEIKTPSTKLFNTSVYRDPDIYSPSSDLGGSIVQVETYKDTITKEFYNLSKGGSYKVINSRCILIIGNTKSLNPEQLNNFDLFRNSLKNIEVLTYDEIYTKIYNLIKLLKS